MNRCPFYRPPVLGVVAILLAVAASPNRPSVGRADEAPPTGGRRQLLPMPTLGGKQFWADELIFGGWRIQRNVHSGHCRLLDENDLRHAWGTFDECRAQLEAIKRERNLPPMQGTAVVVLHGLGRTNDSMGRLCKYLEEHGGFTVVNVSYPSTQRDIHGHATALGRIIEHLDGVERIHFVGHSMGNIVIRRYLTGEREAARRRGATQFVGRPPDTRIGRFVMLAPPNHGSLVAEALSDNVLFDIVTGDAGKQLGIDFNELEKDLATPECEFGIIAGGKGDEQGFTRLLPGDDDGVISVSTTRLAGAADFAVVPVRHTFIMDDERVMRYTLQFLNSGWFVAAERRQPIRAGEP